MSQDPLLPGWNLRGWRLEEVPSANAAMQPRGLPQLKRALWLHFLLLEALADGLGQSGAAAAPPEAWVLAPVLLQTHHQACLGAARQEQTISCL